MKKIIPYIFLTVVAAACSKEPQHVVYEPSDVPILVTGGAEITAESRAAYNGTISSSNPLNARVLASLSPTNFLSTSPSLISGFTAQMTFTGQEASYTMPGAQQYAVPFSSPVYYPANPATNVYVVGFYPFNSWSNSSSVRIGHPINGYEDLMYAPMISTNKNDALASPTTFGNLAFEHKLTLLEVWVARTDASSNTAWGTVRALYLSKVQGATPNARLAVDVTNNSVLYTLQIGTPSATPAMPFPALNFFIGNSSKVFSGQSVVLTTAPQYVAYSMVQPVNIANPGDNGYHIYIRTSNNETDGVEVPISIANAGSTEGKRITILLTFGPNMQLDTTATVTDWITGTTGSGTAVM